MAKKQEPAIARAEEVLERLGSFDEIRRYYESREMAIHDEVTRLTGARAEGIAKGIEEGITKGRAEVIAEIAKSLLDILDDRTISEKTGLAIEEVAKLRLQYAKGQQARKKRLTHCVRRFFNFTYFVLFFTVLLCKRQLPITLESRILFP